MRAPDSFSTGRIRGERLTPAHLPEIRKMQRDPVVMATLGGVMADDETERRHQRNLDHWNEHGFGFYALFLESRFIGRCGLRGVEIEGVKEVEIGWAVHADLWRRGLATEAARACLEIGFGPLALPSIVAFTLPHNLASRRVMEKLGMTFERDFTWAELPHVLYRLRR
jgi:ribosomal-protein-alanine N-acetyltransferase